MEVKQQLAIVAHNASQQNEANRYEGNRDKGDKKGKKDEGEKKGKKDEGEKKGRRQLMMPVQVEADTGLHASGF